MDIDYDHCWLNCTSSFPIFCQRGQKYFPRFLPRWDDHLIIQWRKLWRVLDGRLQLMLYQLGIIHSVSLQEPLRLAGAGRDLGLGCSNVEHFGTLTFHEFCQFGQRSCKKLILAYDWFKCAYAKLEALLTFQLPASHDSAYRYSHFQLLKLSLLPSVLLTSKYCACFAI
jgi:hypothetical protein